AGKGKWQDHALGIRFADTVPEGEQVDREINCIAIQIESRCHDTAGHIPIIRDHIFYQKGIFIPEKLRYGNPQSNVGRLCGVKDEGKLIAFQNTFMQGNFGKAGDRKGNHRIDNWDWKTESCFGKQIILFLNKGIRSKKSSKYLIVIEAYVGLLA